jgi:hypothetical protein
MWKEVVVAQLNVLSFSCLEGLRSVRTVDLRGKMCNQDTPNTKQECQPISSDIRKPILVEVYTKTMGMRLCL